jgi:16S rRNA (uracil1498-N3)-methyltransferase
VRGEAAEHLRRVLRASPGQVYELSDGECVRLGRIENVTRDAIEFSLHEKVDAKEIRLRISLGLTIVKFDRFEWALEKATELGVYDVTPVIAERSERALVAAAAKRAARWRKIVSGSAQQSRRLRAPELNAAQALPEFLQSYAGGSARHQARVFLTEDRSAKSLRDVLEKYPRDKTTAAALAIGPEGGWTETENAEAIRAGFEHASLGSLILRTETAVAAAIASINYALGD